jgi:hypothetical protein
VCESCILVKDWAHNIFGVRIISNPWWPARSHYLTPCNDYLGWGWGGWGEFLTTTHTKAIHSTKKSPGAQYQ